MLTKINIRSMFINMGKYRFFSWQDYFIEVLNNLFLPKASERGFKIISMQVTSASSLQIVLICNVKLFSNKNLAQTKNISGTWVILTRKSFTGIMYFCFPVAVYKSVHDSFTSTIQKYLMLSFIQIFTKHFNPFRNCI